ncbi:MAG: DNA cytosine methyltransferase [Kiritimatiellaeota bacterium]|nr:DNA cytosine methyltransferase [Kiritimatiellota bacterium]
MAKKLKSIDCFCGAGGLSLGFKQAGIEAVYAFDHDPDSIKTYNQYFGDGHAEVADAFKVSKKSIEKFLGKPLPSIDVVIGGPPCQGFSVQRRGSNTDPRNNLVREYVRLLKDIKPKFFLMENVSGILSPRGAAFIQFLKETLSAAGYEICVEKLNAYDFGVPQNRKRVFVIGQLVAGSKKTFSFPLGIKDREKYPATVREAIFDLMELSEDDISNHRGDRLSDINLKRIRSLKAGQGREHLPSELQLPCHSKNDGHRHLDVYGRMAWGYPSSTITARFDSFSRGSFGHPELDRSITLREGARLQTFPDDFIFVGTKVSVARQIGNAVPPRLAQVIAEEILLCLQSQ